MPAVKLSYKNKTTDVSGLRSFARASTLVSAILLAPQVQALQSLDDTDLSAVSGQDGLSAIINIPATGMSISSVATCMDAVGGGCADLSGTDSDKITATGISLSRIGVNGAADSGAWDTSLTLDAGLSASNNASLGIKADWGRVRMAMDSLTLGASASSLGNVVFDASGSSELSAAKGLFHNALAEARLKLHLINGSLFMRNQKVAGDAELGLNKLDLLWDMTGDTSASSKGIVGIDSKGLVISGSKVDFNLAFDMLYDSVALAASELTITPDYSSDKPVLRVALNGGLTSTQLRMGGGGSWLATSLSGSGTNQKYLRPNDPLNPANTGVVVSQGINFGLHTNLDTSFTSTVGFLDPGKTDTQTAASLTFGSWSSLPNTTQTDAAQPALTTYSVDFPLLVLDVIKTSARGPGGLCWGANWEGPSASCSGTGHAGQYLEVAPEADAMALLVRDGFLRAYSTTATFVDTNGASGSSLGWNLLATLGNIDGNIFLYSDARGGANHGIKMDVLLMSQTFDQFDSDADSNKVEQGANWGYGTHFMWGNGSNAIGLMNSSFLFAADNLYVNFLKSGARPTVSGAALADTRPAGISIGDSNVLAASAEVASPVRIALNSRLGMGKLSTPATAAYINTPVNLADIKLNLEFDRFNLMISPGTTSAKTGLGFEATMRFANLNTATFADDISGSATDPGTYFSWVEPDAANASLRFTDIRGWVAARAGRVEIISDSVDLSANTPAQVSIESTLLIGKSVSNVAGDVLRVNRVELGQPSAAFGNLGAVVIPGGQFYSRIAISAPYL